MCKILAIAKKPNANLDIDTLLDINTPDLSLERDGIAGLAIINKKVEVMRNLIDYGAVFDWLRRKQKAASFLAVHTRTATSGNVDLQNTHFFHCGDWFLAHNGIVSGFSSYSLAGFGYRLPLKTPPSRAIKLENILENCGKCRISPSGFCVKHQNIFQQWMASSVNENEKTSNEQGKCDSLQFLEHIALLEKQGEIKPATMEQDILDAVEDKGLSGVAILVNKKTARVLLIVKKDIATLYSPDWLITGSYDFITDWKQTEYSHPFGIAVAQGYSEGKIEGQSGGIAYGVHEIKFT